MNRLSREERAKILALMTEGCSVRSISRLTGHSKNTILSFLVIAGKALEFYQNQQLRNLPCKTIEVDEIWSFCYCKRDKEPVKETGYYGDCWVWTAICADTKLVPCWLVGERTLQNAQRFILDVSNRMANRIQLTSDGFVAYTQAVTSVFGNEVDYAQLVKQYTEMKGKKYGAYSGAVRTVVIGNPDPARISTSYNERHNLTMRMSNRRLARKTNAFSKKVENHNYALAVYFFHYNFIRIHQTLRISPAMAAGITERLWSYENAVEIIENYEKGLN